MKSSLPAALLLFIGLTGCVNIRQINSFSSNSVAGIQKFEDIGYSFRQHCTDACQFKAIRTFDIQRRIECECSLYDQADSVTQAIYNSIKGYFDGLAQLSNNKVTDYKVDALKKSLNKGTFGKIEIDTPEVNAYSRISKILLKATTDLYRRNKLKEYIAEANPPLQILLTKFHFILQSNLEGELKWKEDELYRYYKDMKVSTMTDFEKGQAASEYYQQLGAIGMSQKKIETFLRGIKAIGAGHQKLYDKRNDISAKDLKKSLTQYASVIRDVVSEFNKINQ